MVTAITSSDRSKCDSPVCPGRLVKVRCGCRMPSRSINTRFLGRGPESSATALCFSDFIQTKESLVTKLLGRHLLVELYGCDRARLDDEEFLRSQCVAAAEAMGATVMGVHAHRFQPMGVSVVVVLAESHLAMHTWPEHGTASLDLFVCSATTDPHQAKSHLAQSLNATRTAELELERGRLDHSRTQRWLQAQCTADV